MYELSFICSCIQVFCFSNFFFFVHRVMRVLSNRVSRIARQFRYNKIGKLFQINFCQCHDNRIYSTCMYSDAHTLIALLFCNVADYNLQMEDIKLCEAVQRGLESPAYCSGRYAPQVEKAMHHFHCLLYENLSCWCTSLCLLHVRFTENYLNYFVPFCYVTVVFSLVAVILTYYKVLKVP